MYVSNVTYYGDGDGDGIDIIDDNMFCVFQIRRNALLKHTPGWNQKLDHRCARCSLSSFLSTPALEIFFCFKINLRVGIPRSKNVTPKCRENVIVCTSSYMCFLFEKTRYNNCFVILETKLISKYCRIDLSINHNCIENFFKVSAKIYTSLHLNTCTVLGT